MATEEKKFFAMSSDDVIKSLGSSRKGLTNEEAARRLKEYGHNKLEEKKKKSIISKFIDQFKNLMIIVLLVAAFVSAIAPLIAGDEKVDIVDTIIILFVVIVNAILGVVQENKAEKSLEALKNMSAPFAKVMRGGEVQHIKSEEIVPGDIVILEAGDFVPADMRLIEFASLKIEESALTGESVPVEKEDVVIKKEDVSLGDRVNMAYSGSSTVYGRGVGIVTGTGMNTEVGKIATYLSETDNSMTPLQVKLEELSKILTIAIGIICVLVFVLSWIADPNIDAEGILDLFMKAISLAVAAIPEGLPAVITIVLAMGVQRMAAKNAIIRKLSAVETLGSTEVICSDKTGTLTLNKMTVKELYYSGKPFNAEEIKEFSSDGKKMAWILTLCNDSKENTYEGKEAEYVGDPTETALVAYTAPRGFDKNATEAKYKRVSELPFDSDRKLMTTVNNIEGKLYSLTKGAPDLLVKRCSKILVNGEVRNITADDIKKIEKANSDMAFKALRVLAASYKELSAIPEKVTSDNLENDMIFVGLVGMIDPPRPEVKDAVKLCRRAGIRPVMITGDHKDTAVAIAKEIGIIDDASKAITGQELDKVKDEDYKELVTKYFVYARVSPEHKVKIVKAWKENEKTVAMTGDGVNDAPALKNADIGVGMGITGTDVSKSVSNMVLTDDNFATIVSAVEEGRKIYSNIKKAVQFLLSSNLAEVVAIFVATLLGLITKQNWNILAAVQILWINLVTDAFPALALGVEKAESDVMNKKPRKAKASFFDDGMGVNVIFQGIVIGGLTLLAYYVGEFVYHEHTLGMTMAFATLSFTELFHSFNVRSLDKSLFTIGVFSNKTLVWAILGSSILQLVVLTIPGIANLFEIEIMHTAQWLWVLGLSFSIIPIVEIQKAIYRATHVEKIM